MGRRVSTARKPAVDEAVWVAWGGLAKLPPWTPPDPGARVVVIAPHPDDETLGLGGTLHLLSRRGTAVEVVVLTDGERSNPSLDVHDRQRVVRRRQDELHAALRALGQDSAIGTAKRLRMPDRHLHQHEDELAERLLPLVRGADLVFAPHRQDGHLDHEAAARAAREACEAAGVARTAYAVWLWHRCAPDDPELAWQGAHRVELSAWDRAAKEKAIACYSSQTDHQDGGPVLPAHVLAHHRRPFEVLWSR